MRFVERIRSKTDHIVIDLIGHGFRDPVLHTPGALFARLSTAMHKVLSLGFHDFAFYQTLLRNPMYTNEVVEDVVPGYQSGGYVAIIAHK